MRHLFLNSEPLQRLWDRGEIGPDDLAYALFVFSSGDATWMDRVSPAIYDTLLDAEGSGCRLSLPLGASRDNLVVRLNRMLTYAGYQRVRGSDAELAQKDIPANTTGVRLGWDPPLNTFFATVATEGANPDEDNPHIQLWLGAEPGAIATVDALQDALAAWVIIPEALRQRLAWDQAAEQIAPAEDPQAYRSVTTP